MNIKDKGVNRKMANIKTNAMRTLDRGKIEYKVHSYDTKGEALDGVTVASKIGEPVEKVFKTLVTKGNSNNFYVFVIPANKGLNLKVAARSVGEKSVEMIKVEEINKITGYIRGGCSPIGMKKQYKTVLDKSSENFDSIIVSAGKIGFQVEVSPRDLIKVVSIQVESVAE